MPRTHVALKSELLAATVPYNWIFSVFGLTFPPPLFYAADAGHRKRLYSLCGAYLIYSLLLACLTIWITYINFIAYIETVFDHRLDSVTELLGVSQSFMIVLVQFVMQTWLLFGYAGFYQLRVDVAKLEEDVRASCELRINIDTALGFRWRFARRTGLLLAFVLISFFYVRFHLLTDQLFWLEKVATDITELLIQIKCAEFSLWVQLVHEILLRLQADLLHLRRELRHCKQPALRSGIYRCLQSNQHFVARAWKLCNGIENCFAMPLLMLFLQNGMIITHVANWIYIMSSYSFDYYQKLRAAEAIILIVNVLVPCCLSQLCINLYNQFGNALHKFKSDGTDLKLSIRLREYSLQLMQQKIVFTCGGFFDVNLKNFGGLVLTIVTYVVILIQFKLQTKSKTELTSTFVGDFYKDNHYN